MCQNAQKTLINLMGEIEPSIIALGTEFGLSGNPLYQEVLNEYNVALTAIENWQSGTVAQEVIEVVNDLAAGVAKLPIPATAQTLVQIILAGIATVIGILSANSPAPIPAPTAAVGADATPEEIQAQHQAAAIHDTTVKVQELVPGFKRSIWHSAATQYKATWNAEAVKLNLPSVVLS
jgi:hypothetical protein